MQYTNYQRTVSLCAALTPLLNKGILDVSGVGELYALFPPHCTLDFQCCTTAEEFYSMLRENSFYDFRAITDTVQPEAPDFDVTKWAVVAGQYSRKYKIVVYDPTATLSETQVDVIESLHNLLQHLTTSKQNEPEKTPSTEKTPTLNGWTELIGFMTNFFEDEDKVEDSLFND